MKGRQRRGGGRKGVMTAAALAALFATGACNSITNSDWVGKLDQSPTTLPRGGGGGQCQVNPDGSESCVIEGRPLRRRRRRGLLLPVGAHDTAGMEYASVASFGELALRLVAVGAPAELVEACHRAALDEIRHARTVDALAGRPARSFGAIPALWGRRVGGVGGRSRRRRLQRIAVESFLDGWRNEGAAADALRARAAHAATDDERAALLAMADDEQGHADLARTIVEWCFDEEPAAVGKALAAAAR